MNNYIIIESTADKLRKEMALGNTDRLSVEVINKVYKESVLRTKDILRKNRNVY